MAVKKGSEVERKATASEKKALAKKGAAVDEEQLEYEVSTARRVWEFPEIEDALPDLCVRYREIVEEAKKLEEERKELSSLIIPLLDLTGERTIAGEGWVAVKARGGRTSLSEEKLLAEGVTIDVIERCRVKSSWDYLQVRDPKGAKREAN